MNRLLIAALSFFLLAPVASAATLSMSTAHPAVGDTFSITLMLSTAAGESANAVSSTVTYPQNLLSLIGISKAGSVVSLWPEEPHYSQESGSADFQGVILNPGYSGSAGTMLTLTFRAKAAGTAQLAFNNSSVLANDGQGTDILTGAYGTSFAVSGASAPAPSVSAPAAPAPSSPSGAPEITSTTYPDQNAWYTSLSGDFSWALPSGVKAIRLSYDSSANGTPSVAYTPAIAQKTISVDAPGIYYFHAQFKTAAGWGSVASYRFQVEAPPAAPSVLSYPAELSAGDPLTVSGTSSPEAVVLSLTAPDGSVATATAPVENGAFSLTWPRSLSAGSYRFVVATEDAHGVVGPPSPIYGIEVTPRTGLIGMVGAIVACYPLVPWIGAALLALVVFAFGFLLGRRQVSSPSARLRGEESSFLDELTIELNMLARAARKRDLTKEEEVLLEHIKQRIKHLKRDLK